MLGTLLKYEFKNMSKKMLPLAGILLAFSIVARFTLNDFFNNIYNTVSPIQSTLQTIVVLVFGLSIGVFSVLTLVLCVQRFQKNIFGDEGYLTLTLPVSSTNIVFSKALVAGVWTAFNVGLVLFSIFIAVDGTLVEMMDFLYEIQDALHRYFGIPGWVMLLEIALAFVLNSIFAYSIFYLAITIGQKWTAHRGLGAIFAYIGINIVYSTINNIFSSVFAQFLPNDLFTILMYRGFDGIDPVIVHMYLLISFLLQMVFYLICFVVTSKMLDGNVDLA